MQQDLGAQPPSGAYTVRGLSCELDRRPDGKKYPSDVKERYELTSSGQLKYFAYFGNMPINMNHTDSITWEAGAQGRQVLETIAALLTTPASGIKELPDTQHAPPGAYLIQLTQAHGDSTRYVEDQHSRAWAVIHSAFRALLVRFEQATGRPKKPDQLPQ